MYAEAYVRLYGVDPDNIFRLGFKHVLIYEQPGPEYKGLSVTNGCEAIIASLIRHGVLPQKHPQILLVEFWNADEGKDPSAPRCDGGESWSHVNFAYNRPGTVDGLWYPTDPAWRHMTRASAEMIIGEPIVAFVPTETIDDEQGLS